MIDTLNFKLNHTDYDYQHIQSIFYNKMEFKAATEYKNGSTISVNYQNYSFILSDKNLTAIGSLTKLYFGNNVENLNFTQIQEALMQFETLFEIPFDNAIINRIDIAGTIIMNKPVNMYLDLLTAPFNYHLRQYGNETKLFEGVADSLNFYDKVAEVKKKYKDRATYLTCENKNILKYEIRLTKKSMERLNLTDLTIKDLYDSKMYERLVYEWLQGYIKIPKLTTVLPSQLDYSSLTALKQSLITEGIRSIGGIEVLMMNINQTKVNRAARLRIRNYLHGFSDAKPLSPLLQLELDTKINDFYQDEMLQLI